MLLIITILHKYCRGFFPKSSCNMVSFWISHIKQLSQFNNVVRTLSTPLEFTGQFLSISHSHHPVISVQSLPRQKMCISLCVRFNNGIQKYKAESVFNDTNCWKPLVLSYSLRMKHRHVYRGLEGGYNNEAISLHA